MKFFDFMTIRSDLSGRIFSTAALIAVFMLCAAQAWAATISVTTTDIAAISADGKCSLLEAIQAANTDTAVDACPAGSGADVIELQANTAYTQNVNPLITAAESDYWLTINSDIAINGNGAILGKTGSAPTSWKYRRFFFVSSEGNLTLNKLTILHQTILTGTVYYDNYSGVIFDDGGTLTINNCKISNSNTHGIWQGGGRLTISGTTVEQNDGIGIRSGEGVSVIDGILKAVYSTKDVLIINSVINSNKDGGINTIGNITYRELFYTIEIKNSIIKANGSNTSESKGGIYNSANGDTLKIDNCIISDNNGSGIKNYVGCILVVSNTTISNNKSLTVGGGILNMSSPLTLINSTISGNFGGGIANMAASQTKIINSTIANNETNGSGGGIYNAIIQNSGGPIEVVNSIISGNSDLSSPIHPDVYGPITGNHNNLIGNLTGATGTIGTGSDIVNPNPLLDTLKSNGGFTQTHALLKDSPAIDKGDNAICAGADVGNIDQRGKTRPYGTSCDIGSYEYRPCYTDVCLEAISYPYQIWLADNFDVTFKLSSSKSFIQTDGYLRFDACVLQVSKITRTFIGGFYSNYDNDKGEITFGAWNIPSNLPEYFTVSFNVIGMKGSSTVLDFDDSKNITYDIGYDVLSQTSEDVRLLIDYVIADKDADGVLNTVENNAPDGDGNGDGIFDSVQNNVTSLPSVFTNDYITL